MLRALVVTIGCLLAAGGIVAGCSASPEAAMTTVDTKPDAAALPVVLPKPPPVLLNEIERTFELGSRAGKGGWPKAMPPGTFPSPALDAAYSTFAALRNGDDYDRIVSKAACFAMSQGPASTSSPAEQEWERRMYEALPFDFHPEIAGFTPGGPPLLPAGPYNWLIKNQVTRYAKALAVIQTTPGSVTRYYLEYCF